jgi:WD40 repeat protein
VRQILVAAALMLGAAQRVSAQLPPNEDWRTLRTAHFRVHFTPAVEEEARRAAVNAERAYTELATELVPPRGTIDLVLSDNVDFVNGYATPFPSNRIVVYAHPPTDASGLRNYQDWNALVVTHELTHIFHLDRTRGIWRLGQAIFGRNPLLFPNVYEPSWVVEGLAVYYESRLTGVGRLESGEHSMIARAAALANRLPTLQELSPETSRFPGGEVVYVYGSLLFDYLSRTRGPASVRDFVERGARTPFPFVLTWTSRRAFGESFQTAWNQWRDSLVREMRKTPAAGMPEWRDLTPAGRTALFPRWLGDTAILYAGATGREVPAAYEVTLDGARRNIGRRNGTSPNIKLPDGSIVFSQPDYLDPYHIREDLYVQRDGHQSRLTRGARLSTPDVRPDGEIVAVQAVAATTRLALVSPAGRITPITATSLDTQWMAPRWSPDGSRIVAIEQSRGVSQFVILDREGHRLASFGASREINSDPSWSSDGRTVFFSSERAGAPQIFAADLTKEPVAIARLTDVATGAFSPELSPDRGRLASVLFLADGDHIGIGPVPPPVRSADTGEARVAYRANCANCVSIIAGLPPAGTIDTSRATRYSPWRSLLPRYWQPVLESGTWEGTSLGATTGGYDIVDRHDYTVELLRNNRLDENSAWLSYRYAGLGLPLLDVYAAQEYSNSEFTLEGSPAIAILKERDRTASLQATFVRPRYRTYSRFSFGGELETFSYATSPDSVLGLISSFFSRAHTLPSVVASAAWSNARRPELSISPEDGLSVSLNARQRWERGTAGQSTRSIVGVTSLYKSLDLPGFAHHVLALRAAGGIADERSFDLFSAGGISGTSVDVFPGISVGQPRRTFGVRGYPTSAERGIRAYSASLEYRAPLTNPSRGVRFIPVFFDKTSFSLFGETGRAFCPANAAALDGGICELAGDANPVMTSVGAELNIDTGIQLDFPARLRFGVAFPLANREQVRAAAAQLYGTFGASF